MSLWPNISVAISNATNSLFILQSTPQAVVGGSINQCFLLEGSEQSFFIKLNQSGFVSMFEAEYQGLLEIHRSKTIRTPKPLCFGVSENNVYLIMEYIPFTTHTVNHAELGRQLAAMHQTTQRQFGWHRNNTIGSTPQINTREDSWCHFWQNYRLQHQLNLAQQQGYGGRLQQLGEQLIAQMNVLFASYNPPASLLHGDLWSGNYSGAHDGTPVVFDPAVYYGDRETDLAMTELFGGFSAEFYAAYNEAYPLDSGYNNRKNLYNLYHVLNHVNIFGHSYIAQAENIMQRLLEEM